jgi:hypothetical protein
MSYQDKYIKYKMKYLNLQNQLGSGPLFFGNKKTTSTPPTKLNDAAIIDYFNNNMINENISQEEIIKYLIDNESFIDNLTYSKLPIENNTVAYKIFNNIDFMSKLLKIMENFKPNPTRVHTLLKNIEWAKPDKLSHEEFVKLGLTQEDKIIDYFKEYANTDFKKNMDYITEIIIKNIGKNHKILLYVDNSVRNNEHFFRNLLSKISKDTEKDLIKLYANREIRNKLIENKKKFIQEHQTIDGREIPTQYRFKSGNIAIDIPYLDKEDLLNGDFKIF